MPKQPEPFETPPPAPKAAEAPVEETFNGSALITVLRRQLESAQSKRKELTEAIARIESEEGDEDHEMQHGAAPEGNELTDEVPS